MTTLRERIAAATHSPDPNVRIDAVERLVEQETATLMDTLAKRSNVVNTLGAENQRLRAVLANVRAEVDNGLHLHGIGYFPGAAEDALLKIDAALDDQAEDER